MSKRGRSSTLTGGTGDVSPQWFSVVVNQSAADVLTTATIPLPVQRLKENGKSMVMEVLKVVWDLPFFAPTAGAVIIIGAYLTTKNPQASNATFTAAFEQGLRSAGTTIDYHNREFTLSGAGTGSTQTNYEPIFHDINDGAGHGLLVATDNVFLTISSVINGVSTNTGQVNGATCRLLYRWKDVTLQEYIGIVQSQQ